MEDFLKDCVSLEISSDSSCEDHGRGCILSQNTNTTIGNIIGCRPPTGFDLNYACMVIAEMVGTSVPMFCESTVIAITQATKGEVGLAEYVMTVGVMIVVLVYSIVPILGAHINPAITLAFAAFGQFPWSRVPLYVFAQIFGLVIGTCIGGSVYRVKKGLKVTRPLQWGSTSTFCVEMFATFMIVFVIASLADNHQALQSIQNIPFDCFLNSTGIIPKTPKLTLQVSHLTSFIAGITIGLVVLITGPISGGSMNPARSLGPAVVSQDFGSARIYILSPLAGATAGGRLRCLGLQHVRFCHKSSLRP